MTIKEVAELAGVSTAAVSRYFNGGSLSMEKSERIRAVVEKNSYTPNAVAQAMRTGRSGQIGVIVPKIQSHSVSLVLTGLMEHLEEQGYSTLLGCTFGRKEAEAEYIESMQKSGAEGIILMGTTMTALLRTAIADCRIPLVVAGQNYKNVPCVYHDDENAMRDMATLVLTKRKHVAYIGVNEADSATGKTRKKGVQKAFRKAGLDPDAMPHIISGFDVESGYLAGQELLKKYPKTDGVICASDHIAHGVMRALKDAGKAVPEDVSVTGVGDSWEDLITDPTLTTVGLYYEECGRAAAKLLQELIEEPEAADAANRIKLGYEIVERGSI